jgi:hypothetical protein
MTDQELPDGLDALRSVLDLTQVMALIERTARWVDPATFRLLPVWYPEYGRRSLFYKSNWSEPQLNTNRRTGISEHKREGNLYANKALTTALGLRSRERPNWSCCHIWGVDDQQFQEANEIVQDPRFYSCIANMVLLPTPLKAFTDAMPEVKAMLRIAAQRLYGWHCDHEAASSGVKMIDAWERWDSYPASWPKAGGATSITGMVPLNDRIRTAARKRVDRLRSDLARPGENYPADSVTKALNYWKIDLETWSSD